MSVYFITIHNSPARLSEQLALSTSKTVTRGALNKAARAHISDNIAALLPETELRLPHGVTRSNQTKSPPEESDKWLSFWERRDRHDRIPSRNQKPSTWTVSSLSVFAGNDDIQIWGAAVWQVCVGITWTKCRSSLTHDGVTCHKPIISWEHCESENTCRTPSLLTP